MQLAANVNYYIRSAQPQTVEIDSGGTVGAMTGPTHEVVQVRVNDVRSGQAKVTFSTDSLTFLQAATQVASFHENETWRSAYDQELTSLLSRELGAQEVIVFDHTLRVDDPSSERRPARNVHTDYSRQGAEARMLDLLGAERALDWRRSHYAFVNVWRPVGSPVQSAPLGFVRPSSVSPDDWVPITLVYPDRVGHIMGLAAKDGHDWLYLSDMRPDEVAIFNVYDSRGQPAIAHSALDSISGSPAGTIRQSIESRTLIRYKQPSLDHER